MSPSRPVFPRTDVDKIARKIEGLPVIGKPIAPKSSLSCRMCNRKIEALGRLPALGFPTCGSSECELTKMGDLGRLFSGPYGQALDRSVLGMFCQLPEMPDGRVLIQRLPLVSRASALADAMVRLIGWQQSFDHFEWFFHPEQYEKGALALIPPRKLDDVLILRAREAPVPIDPVGALPPETARTIRQIFHRGIDAIDIGF